MTRYSLSSFVSKKLTLVTFGAVLTAFLFNGCGWIGNAFMSDDTFAEKSAFALDTTSDKVQISNRKGGFFDIDFTATTLEGKKEKSHQCYVQTLYGIGFLTSDAICSGMKSNSKNCNALLKAAGKC